MAPKIYPSPAPSTILHCLGFLASCACLLFAVTGARAQNLLKNSGFEDPIGSPEWTFSRFGGATSDANNDTAQFHWEEQSAKLTFGGASTPQTGVYSQLTQTVTNLTVGKTYYAYLWAKGRSAGSSGIFAIKGIAQASTAIPTGTYDWRLLECSFTADTTTLQLFVAVKTTTEALWLDDAYLTENRRRDVSTLGIPGNDTDVTAAISSALATYKFLYFPPGTYRVNGTIAMPKGAVIEGAGDATTFKQVGNASGMFNASGNDNTFVGDNEFTAFKVAGANLASTSRTTNYIAYYKTARNVRMRHCTANPGNLIRVATHKATYADITSESQMSANIHVSFCNATGPNVDGFLREWECISFSYVTDTEIYKNTIRFYGMGIKVWGGNAAFGTAANTNGAMTNPRWARRHRVASNVCDDMENAGIFICMGQDVVVENNSANRSADIAIDFEGCFDCVANDNVASDGLNGALASFYGTKNLTFRGNTVTSTVAAYPLFRLYNSSYNASYVLNVVLEENTFQCTSGLGLVDDHKGPGNLTIRDNTFSNVVIDISHRGMGTSVPGPSITGNTMDFTVSTDAPVTAINLKVAAGKSVVSGNTVRWNAAYGRPTKTGIMYRRVLTASQTIDIVNNYLSGFGAAAVDVYHGQANVTLNLRDNRVGSIMYVGAQGRLTLNASNNRDLDGAFVSPVWVGNIPAPQTLSEWTTAHGLSGANASADSDADGDGWPNLLEYAFGLDPNKPDGAQPVEWKADGDRMIFRFTRSKATIGVSYTAQMSTDLVSWSSAGRLEVESSTPANETLSVSIATGPSELFVRLQVSSE